MNVKTFASMVKGVSDESQIVIDLVGDAQTDYEGIARYNNENPYHVAAYGEWCIDKIIGVSADRFELLIKTIRTVEIVKE